MPLGYIPRSLTSVTCLDEGIAVMKKSGLVESRLKDLSSGPCGSKMSAISGSMAMVKNIGDFFI